MTKTTITINGRLYDATTGLPVPQEGQSDKSARQEQNRQVSDISVSVPLAQRASHAAQTVHRAPQRSQTLQRQPLHNPASEQIRRSPAISRFSKESVQPAAVTHIQHTAQDHHATSPASIHPAVAKALQSSESRKPKEQLSGTDLKEKLIKEKLAEVKETPAKKESWLGRQPKLITVLSSTLALLILGGYLTYITLPSISLKVAASRAGVNATMPEYKPDGYNVDGPITYSPGEVVISYKSSTNNTNYKLIQKSTNWDSQAVLDNYVTKNTSNYLTFQERGLTVYTFSNKAVWVNGGILYTIDGNATLSSEQLMKLVTSI